MVARGQVDAAAREIALALGVPPMLLGIPGDNTYANYQEATRSFWRQSVLPLVDRTAKALSGWLAPAWGEGLVLKADLDQVEALSPEREALWARLEAASFLTVDEKRAAVGYGPLQAEGGDGVVPEIGARVAPKYSPEQPRVPAGNADGGQWTSGGGGGGPAPGADDGLVLSDADEPGLVPWDEVAQNDTDRYRVNLQAEEMAGGHTFREHVGKSREALRDRVRRSVLDDPDPERHNIRSGSFPSIEAAERLVNSTLTNNRGLVDLVASGAIHAYLLCSCERAK